MCLEHLKRFSLLFLVFSLPFSKLNATIISNPILISDTTKPSSKPYKLSEKEFMIQYGKDDTSRALIHYFFDKRTKASRMFYVPLIIDALAVIVVAISGAFATVSMSYPLALLFFILSVTTVTLFIIGAVYLLKYPRKKLFQLISRYNMGGSVPKKIKANKYFKLLLLKYK
jgi:hypothetical protein